MKESIDRCSQLRKLRDRLVDELEALKVSVQQEELEGVGNPIEMINITKSLQETLNRVDQELQKCPDEG